MNDAHRGGESQVDRAMRHSQSIFRTAHPAAQHGIDVDVKISVFGQQGEFLVEHLQAFLRDIVRHHVVDADLQILEAGTIQPFDAIGYQQISVRNQPGNDSVLADPCDDGVQIRMEQGFAATDRDYPGTHFAEPVDSTEHFLRWNRTRNIVKLVTVGAREITTPRGNDMNQQRVARRNKSLRNHTNGPQPAMGRQRLASNSLCKFHNLRWFSRSPRRRHGNFVSAKLQLCHSATKFPGTIVSKATFSRCDCAVPFMYNPGSSNLCSRHKGCAMFEARQVGKQRGQMKRSLQLGVAILWILVVPVASARQHANAVQMKIKVIADQDSAGPQGTNFLSLLMLLRAPQIDLLGITTISGDQWVDPATVFALWATEQAGRTDVPVIKGAEMPLLHTQREQELLEKLYVSHPTWHGSFNPDAPPPSEMWPPPGGYPKVKARPGRAADFIVDTIRANPGEVVR